MRSATELEFLIRVYSRLPDDPLGVKIRQLAAGDESVRGEVETALDLLDKELEHWYTEGPCSWGPMQEDGGKSRE